MRRIFYNIHLFYNWRHYKHVKKKIFRTRFLTVHIKLSVLIQLEELKIEFRNFFVIISTVNY